LVSKINLKARIERHSRVLQHGLYTGSKKSGKKWISVVSLIAVALLPIYPTFAGFVNQTSATEFYRGDIDESSIISSYFWDDEDETVGDGSIFIQSKDSYLHVNAALIDITRNSIYWANNFEKNHIIQPGDIIKVPPVSGLIHTVQSGETLLGLANKYNIDSEDINSFTQSAPAASSQYVNSSGRYKLVWRSPFSGVWGNCTWYVASYKNVNWRGNANQWMRNARAKGHATGSNPSIWAIVQFAGRGYNPYYGHVGIVIDMTSNHIIVSDMNYRRLGEVTTRKVPINDRTIQWYIYVD